MKNQFLQLLMTCVLAMGVTSLMAQANCIYDTEAPSIDCNVAGPQNQLNNSSFETNNGNEQQGFADWDQLGPWFAIEAGQNIFPGVIAGPAQEGDFYAKTFANGQLSQTFPANGNESFSASVYMLNFTPDPIGVGGGALLRLEFLGGPPAIAESAVFTDLSAKDVWTPVSVSATTPLGTTGVRVTLVQFGPGAVFFDNASLINNAQVSGQVGDVSVENDPGLCGAQLALATPATADNCTVVSVTNDYTGTGNASGFYPVGTTTVTWTVTDDGLGADLPDVAMLFATGGVPNAEADVLAKLTATGAFNSVTSIDVAFATPSLATLLNYDAVLVWNDDPFANEFALGDVLADYVDAGGGVAVSMFTQWSPSNFDLQGAFRTNGYLPLDGNASPFQAGGPYTMNIVNGAHPIMQGVSSFNGGSASFRGTSLSLQPGASLLANWSTGDPLIAYKEPSNGRTVSLNFYPPSNDIRPDLWNSSTDGDLIMANALLWAAGHVRTPNTATCSVDITVTDTEAPTLDCNADGPPNLLLNESFESNNGHDTPGASNWVQFGQVFNLDQNVIGTAQEGDFFVKMFGGNTGLFQDHPVNPGDELTASVYVQNASFDPMLLGCQGFIKLEYFNSGGGFISVSQSLSLDDTLPLDVWTQLTLDDTAPAGATTVRMVVIMQCTAGGAVMFDNASLTNNPPNAGLYGDLTVEADPDACGAQLTLAVPVSGDNCPGATLINDFNGTGDASGFFPVGVTPITWTITDDSENAVDCVQTITVVDTTPPSLTIPPTATIECGDDESSANTGLATGSDACGNVVITEVSEDQIVPDCLGGIVKAIKRTWTATDVNGNEVSADQTIVVEDTTGPDLTCPEDIVVCEGDANGNVVEWTVPTPTDVCSSAVTLVGSADPGDVFPIGIHTVTYTATDECGNETQCSFDVIVNPPLSVDAGDCQRSFVDYGPAANTNILQAVGDGGTGPYTYSWAGDFITTDPSDPTGATVTVDPTAEGFNEYTVTITDANGCMATDLVYVYVESVICTNNNQNNEKIVICHMSNSGMNTLCVSENAVDNHIGPDGHGDTWGTCDNPCDLPPVPGIEPGDIADGNQNFDKELTVENQLSIYPNPNSGIFTIVTDMEDYMVSIYEISGKLVSQEMSTQSKLNIDLSQVESGIYFVQLNNDRAMLTKKVIIEH